MERQPLLGALRTTESIADQQIDAQVDRLLQPPPLPPNGGLEIYLKQHNLGNEPLDLHPPGQTEWTVFVNLAGNHLVNNAGLRLDHDLQDDDFIEQTRDKPIKIIVQVAVNNDPRRDSIVPPYHHDPIDAILLPTIKDMSVVRYEISNGEKHLLGSGPSSGAVGDLSDLLASEPEALKAKHVMLIDEAHGGGMSGLVGDTGPISASELTSAVNNAMARVGKKTVDVLDLIACEMTDMQTLTDLGKAGKYIVASEYPEYSLSIGSNLQPVAQPLADLMAHLESSPLQAAKTIYKSSSDVCKADATAMFTADMNQGFEPCGTLTLGVYDSSAMAQLNKSLNALGQALVNAGQDDSVSATLRSISASLPKVYVSPEHASAPRQISDEQHKDLGMFLNALDTAIINQKLPDTADGALSNAVIEVRKAMKRAVVANFNATDLEMRMPEALRTQNLPVRPSSGISTFIPSNYHDFDKRFSRLTSSNVQSGVTVFQKVFEDNYFGKNQWDPNALKAGLAKETKAVTDTMATLNSPEATKFSQSQQRFMSFLSDLSLTPPTPQTMLEYFNQKQEYNSNLIALLKGGVADNLGVREARKTSASILHDNQTPSLTDWNKFLSLLANQSGPDLRL